MFSLFSALGLNQASDSPLRRIPYYASLFFVELLRDSNNGGKLVVQFSFKNGLEVSTQMFSDACFSFIFCLIFNSPQAK